MTWLDVRNSTDSTIKSIQELVDWIISFLTNSQIFTDLNTTIAGNTIISTIQSTALTLCVLFFLISFFQKSLHLQWVTWENVMMFFMKLVLAKIILGNAGGILAIIQNGFNSILTSASVSLTGTTLFPPIIPEYLTTGGTVTTHGSNYKYVQYFFSPSHSDFENIVEGSSSINVKATFDNVQVFLIGLIMKIIFISAAIIVVARMFELLVYTVIAPLPLATLSCDGLQDIGKGFLKSFTAICLQATVIVVMFVVFSAMISSDFLNMDSIDANYRDQLKMLLMTFVFGAGIMQSGNWSKKICGAM